MKERIITTCLALFVFTQIYAQISEGGLPPSFNYKSALKSEPAPAEIPISFNVEDLILIDEWQVAHGSPLRVATSIPVDLDMDNSGSWSILPGGEKIWQLRIRAEGAKALMLYYKTFIIPEGGKLFIYNADKTQILGAYTQRTNLRDDFFATEFIAGDDIILEYVSTSSDEQARIDIEEIGYGYNHLNVSYTSELRSSGSCMVNINCSEGSAWQKEKAGVCHTIQKIGTSSYICSGSLVNNTAEDFKPYVLMAYHCMEASKASSGTTVSTPEEMKQWVFYFNYERQGCSNSVPATYKTMTGCTKVASTPLSGGSDGLLLLLDQDIPESYNVYYNGWDRSNTAPQSGVSIHHPSGDYKKISTYTNKGEHATWYGTDSVTGTRSGHWNVTFAETENGHGVTEGGSSGSPLFNQNHLIVGTLSGGSSSCDEPDGLNLYGKLAYHWNKYSLADTARMDIWLDPEGTSAETLEGLSHTTTKPAPTNLKLSYKNKEVSISWTSPNSTETPDYYTIYRTNQVIGTTENTSFTDTEVNLIGEVFYSITAEYSDESESLPLSGSIIIQEYKAPENLLMNKNGNEVTLSWDKPIYTQAISWSTSEPSFAISANIPVYFGQAWDADDLLNIENNLITAIECYIANDATYEVYIVQGERTYKQSVAKSSYSEIKTIELTTPFVIDASNELIISLYTSSTNDDIGAMACDAGPAVIGKGNLISEDGQEWFVLYDGTDESEELGFDSNCNFYLAAIVSSEKGTVSTLKSFSSKNHSKQYSGQLQKIQQAASLRATTESTLFQYPAAFPEITGYKVYRNSELLTTDPINAIEYTDKASPTGIHTYGVSTVYGTEESDTISSEISVANQQIINETITLAPTLFTNQIRIENVRLVDKLEIYTISGLLVRQIRNPEETIGTSSLTPGIYIFKLHTQKGILIFEGIKQ